MEFQEYPKALYRQGECAHVHDEAEEAAKRDDGYDDWHADHARTEGVTEGDDSATDQPLDRDALKVKATELGIEFAPNIKTDKLAALVAAAEAQ